MSAEVKYGWLWFWAALACVFAVLDIAYGQDLNVKDRYSLERTDDGFVRMDRQTGAMSICREQAGGLVCRQAADDRIISGEDIAALKAENQLLKARIAAISDVLKAEGPVPAIPVTPKVADRGLPSEEEIDEAMDMFEGVMNRFFGMVDRLREGAEPVPPPNRT